MNALTPIPAPGFRYDHIIATGGIGSGIFFSLNGNETIGRNESRMAELLPYKDYCKQHIILHYMAVLLGAKPGGPFRCLPIGKVGNDEIGKALLSMMKTAGIDTSTVHVYYDRSTLFSVCYQYPDYSAANITSAGSASSLVSADDISDFFRQFSLSAEKEIILAVPEVPVETRIKLLEYGRLRNSYNVASVLTSEIEQFKELGGFSLTDVLAVNLDEACRIAQVDNTSESPDLVIAACISKVTSINPSITLLITCGAKGVYCYSANVLEFTPAIKVPVVSTAGAGDAFLSGFLCGVCCGLPLLKELNDEYFAETPVATAVELGVLLASISVTSPDTINTDASAEAVLNFSNENQLTPAPGFGKIFSGCTQPAHPNILN